MVVRGPAAEFGIRTGSAGLLRAGKGEIQQKIINNGVPASGFSLAIVPNDQPDQPGAQVVGHCANDTFKIIYTRSGDAAATDSDGQ